VASPAAALLAASLVVPFGAPVPVHLAAGVEVPVEGTVVGDFLVAATQGRGRDGGGTVVLRPLALGSLPVPLAGDPPPGEIDVRPTLAADAAVAGVIVPASPPLPWLAFVAAVVAVAVACLGLAAGRRRGRRDPLAELERALRPLALPAAWGNPHAADGLARDCRLFLHRLTGAPCTAMTTRELSRLLAVQSGVSAARPFGLAFVLADEVRFAGSAAPPDDAVRLVTDLLAAAPALAAARGTAQ
jgi:hypothetical protein